MLENFKSIIILFIFFKGLACSQKCGVPVVTPLTDSSPKIINGTVANPDSWPWMVSLRRSSNGKHFCGGSILDSKTILTAAHCVDWINFTSDFFATIGINSLNETLITGINSFKVKSFKIHWNYNKKRILNDIAIVKLKKALTFTDEIQPICLPPSFNLKIVLNKDIIVAGW